MTTAKDITDIMTAMQDEEQRRVLLRFFKCGIGEYGEGDWFLGLKVPQTRAVVRAVKGTVSLDELKKLIYSPWHEIRLCGFLLLADEMQQALPKGKNNGNAVRRKELVDFYLNHTCQSNNWDLVDLSCEYILGDFLLCPLPDGTMPSRDILDCLAASDNLWNQRISIVSTLELIRHNQYDDTIRIAKMLLCHPHDLIHKAVGWMLREVGKRDINILETFMEKHYHSMPRTTLRYAIEKMDESRRLYWLKRK